VVKHFMPIVKWLGVALYAAVLVVAPFTHHDLVCHFKNPQHCTACTSNQLGTDPAALRAPRFRPLVDAGRAVQIHALAEGVLLAADSTGRSPPRQS
jgi:hypothetical protein